MRNVNLAVIHCLATKEGKDYNVDQVRTWHILERGFSDIGYHFLVHRSGIIEEGRPWDKPGAHARGYNENSVGIVYVGGLDKDGKARDTRTVAQVHALRSIVSVLRAQFPGIEVVGHRDLSVDLNGDGVITPDEWMKECPCFDVKTEL